MAKKQSGQPAAGKGNAKRTAVKTAEKTVAQFADELVEQGLAVKTGDNEITMTPKMPLGEFAKRAKRSGGPQPKKARQKVKAVDLSKGNTEGAATEKARRRRQAAELDIPDDLPGTDFDADEHDRVFTKEDFGYEDNTGGYDEEGEGSLTSERGCGTQTEGGIYSMCPLSPYGQPIEYFLIDPPRLDIPPGVRPRGTSFIEDTCHDCKGTGNARSRGGVFDHLAERIIGSLMNPKALEVPAGKCVSCFGSGKLTHIVDWVGENNYSSVADFIEETRRLGMSRKLSPKMDYSRLTPGSRQMFIHPRAHIKDFKKYYKAEHDFAARDDMPEIKACPKGAHGWDASEMCARLYWQDIYGGESLGDPRDPREVRKQLPCKGVYRGLRSLYDEGRKKETKAGRYKAAFFLWLPIQLIGVIAAPGNKEKEKQSVKAAEKAHIPVKIIKEGE